MESLQTHWRTSSYTNPNNSNCVEVGPAPGVVGVRDTKNRAQGHFTVPRTVWTAFVRGIAQTPRL